MSRKSSPFCSVFQLLVLTRTLFVSSSLPLSKEPNLYVCHHTASLLRQSVFVSVQLSRSVNFSFKLE